MISRYIVVAIGLLVASTAWAETLRCSFVKGVSNSDDGRVTSSGYQPGAWEAAKTSGGALDWRATKLHFIVKHTRGEDAATLSGNNDTVKVLAVSGNGFTSFVEFAPSGGVHVMSVASTRSPNGSFLAAYSRHAIQLGKIVVSQYWGSCE